MTVYIGKNASVEIVDAEKRGDRCYAGRRGWYWHLLDEQMGIDERSLHGPFTSKSEARDNAIVAVG